MELAAGLTQERTVLAMMKFAARCSSLSHGDLFYRSNIRPAVKSASPFMDAAGRSREPPNRPRDSFQLVASQFVSYTKRLQVGARDQRLFSAGF
jgi:hypothetical protein